jgi:hypothetical protein
MKTFIAQTTRKYTPENWFKHYKGQEINRISKALQTNLSQNRNYICKTLYNIMNLKTTSPKPHTSAKRLTIETTSKN